MTYTLQVRPPQTGTRCNWRDVMPVHPAADLFPRMSEQELRELGNDIKKHGLHSPITIYKEVGADGVHYSMLDGINRLDAMELVGIKFNLHFTKNGFWMIQSPKIPIDAAFRRCVWRNPLDFVLSANIKRRHLTAEQKRDLIEKVLKATPKKSDRQIADETKSNRTTVGQIRKTLEASGDVSIVDTRTDAMGRKQQARKPAKKKRRDIDERKAKQAVTIPAEAPAAMAEPTDIVTPIDDIEAVTTVPVDTAITVGTCKPVDTAKSAAGIADQIRVNDLVMELQIFIKDYRAAVKAWHQTHPNSEHTSRLADALINASRLMQTSAGDLDGLAIPASLRREEVGQ
jgi:ParB-like nuclease family protein